MNNSSSAGAKGNPTRSEAALDKLCELVGCGDKRIELSSAKEVLSLLGLPEISQSEQSERLEVEIKVVT
ncbi:MAG TPA: hypothetical protein H9900_01295 [Candidatus Monoglobus merdigallinarum]|uniref:Uncharacterized protein n=1 Tax=Candidatus Monoglobus merdigallinarum TaxID=2838698 RepID=A0A9D1TLD7_9FIRM|nr:hypothetical protein [Candidatus Monoglobus merdigallinarum]